uniref:Glutathione S-transferase n=1 Tax=Nothobranchius furzeri TaxID=105023 RepID=A0A8C6LQ06_NOTFU
MSEKVILHYFNARGKMESIRWLLTVAEVEVSEDITVALWCCDFSADGSLMFQQVPMVEIDGMKLVQTKAILHYIAEKYSLYGKDIKERVMINMYSEGLMDLMEMIMIHAFVSGTKAKLDDILTKAKERYLPVYEKALSGPVYLVGGKLSLADVQLLECTLMLEEKFPAILADFPNTKVSLPRATVPLKFLQPGSKRKPQPDEKIKKTKI